LGRCDWNPDKEPYEGTNADNHGSRRRHRYGGPGGWAGPGQHAHCAEAANRWIKNPNLIYAGQVVHVPDGRSGITPMAPTYYQAPAASSTPSASSDTSAAASTTPAESTGTSSASTGYSASAGTSASTGTPSASTGTSSASTGSSPSSFQQCVSWRESGNNPTASSSGLYGILPSTWASLGYSGTAGSASVAQQNQAFQQLYAQDGTSPWAPYDGC
jgi:hypothetical protein